MFWDNKYRVTHKKSDFSDDLKLLKSSDLLDALDLFLSYDPDRQL